MKKIIKNNLWAIWLSSSLGVFDITPLDWPFYVILVPTIIFVAIGRMKIK